MREKWINRRIFDLGPWVFTVYTISFVVVWWYCQQIVSKVTFDELDRWPRRSRTTFCRSIRWVRFVVSLHLFLTIALFHSLVQYEQHIGRIVCGQQYHQHEWTLSKEGKSKPTIVCLGFWTLVRIKKIPK